MPIKRAREQATVTLASVITDAENKTRGMDNNIDDITRKIDEITEELSTLPNERYTILKRKLLEDTKKTLTDELEKITSGEYLKRLDDITSKFTVNQNRIENAIAAVNKKTKGCTHQAYAATLAKDSEKLLNEYKSIVQGTAPTVVINNDDSTCIKCGGAVLMQPTRSLLNCQECGYSAPVLDATASAVSFGDEVVFNQSFSYKKSNHFGDWLLRTQAKETYVVSDSIVKIVMEELANLNVHPDDVDQNIVLRIMKDKKLKSKAYNYAAQVTMRCTGIPPPRLTSEMDQLANLIFIAIQEPYTKHMPASRKNFLSYSYCIYRIYELLGADDLLSTLPLLSGRGKLPKQDAIMKKIYEDMDWEWPGDLPEPDK